MSLFVAETQPRSRDEYASLFFPNKVANPIDSILLTKSRSEIRRDLLKRALLEKNEASVAVLINEYGYLIGIEKAIDLLFEVWGELIREQGALNADHE